MTAASRAVERRNQASLVARRSTVRSLRRPRRAAQLDGRCRCWQNPLPRPGMVLALASSAGSIRYLTAPSVGRGFVMGGQSCELAPDSGFSRDRARSWYGFDQLTGPAVLRRAVNACAMGRRLPITWTKKQAIFVPGLQSPAFTPVGAGDAGGSLLNAKSAAHGYALPGRSCDRIDRTHPLEASTGEKTGRSPRRGRSGYWNHATTRRSIVRRRRCSRVSLMRRRAERRRGAARSGTAARSAT